MNKDLSSFPPNFIYNIEKYKLKYSINLSFNR